MMDQVLAVGKNPDATYEDLCALKSSAFAIAEATYGPSMARWPISAWGPLAGVMDGMFRHDEYYAWARRSALIVNRALVWWILRVMGVKKRPGYNDFLLVRWALNRDEETALELIERSRRADSIGCSLCWALGSLCQQYPEFAARFNGFFPQAQPEHMLNDLPRDADPPEIVLARARQFTGVAESPTATETRTKPKENA